MPFNSTSSHKSNLLLKNGKLLLPLSPRLWKRSQENIAKKGKFQASMQFHHYVARYVEQVWHCKNLADQEVFGMWIEVQEKSFIYL